MSLFTKAALTGPLAKIYFCTVITFCSLYAAQRSAAVPAEEFALSPFQAILFTTLMMLPLDCALFYGCCSNRFRRASSSAWRCSFSATGNCSP